MMRVLFQKSKSIQAALEQLLAPDTIDDIVNILANGEFCTNNGDERCPAAVDVVIRQGLPMLIATLSESGFDQV